MVKRKSTKGQTTRWSKEKDRRTDNTMVKRKRQDRQHDGQKKKTEEQTTRWSSVFFF
jgi:hypothetical protein